MDRMSALKITYRISSSDSCDVYNADYWALTLSSFFARNAALDVFEQPLMSVTGPKCGVETALFVWIAIVAYICLNANKFET
jgi:hypothetical protein